MMLEWLRRLGPLPFTGLFGAVIVLAAVGLVALLDLPLKGEVVPRDLLIGALTALAIGPLTVYLPLRLTRQVEILRAELDQANHQLRSEAEALRELSGDLTRANQRLGFSQSIAKLAYFELDLNSGEITGSRDLTIIFPLEPDALPTATAWRRQVHPEDRAAYDAQMARCARQAATVEFDFRLAAGAERERWLHLYGEPAPGERGSAARMVGIVQDVTERRQSEVLRRANEQLLLDNAALAEADRLKDEFLATMSHELRTPLTGVLSLSEALQEEVYGPLNERQQHHLKIIESSGLHLLRLINDILDLAKIRAGKADIVPEDVRLEQFCRPALATIHRLAADKSISVEAPDAYPDILMHVDPLRCKQVLLNLLGNAIKFTPEGGRLGLKITHDPLSDWVLCTVWDTGIGIPAHDLDKLFQPFTQLDSKLARSYGGAGLGLCLAQRLAEQQGGQVTVTSKPGSGSQFTLQLPLPPLRQPVPLARAVPSPGLSTASILHRSPARILVVDDVQINGEIYRDYLERKGFQVMLAKNGADALVLATNERPDVILMDIQMPVMDGLEATRRLRACPEPALAVTPVIALTALAMAGDEQRCLDAGCDTYLEKPVRLYALLRSVTEQVQRRDDAVAAQQTRVAASISNEAYRARQRRVLNTISGAQHETDIVGDDPTVKRDR